MAKMIFLGDMTLSGVARSVRKGLVNERLSMILEEPDFDTWQQAVLSGEILKLKPEYLCILLSPRVLAQHQNLRSTLPAFLKALEALSGTHVFMTNFVADPIVPGRILHSAGRTVQAAELNISLQDFKKQHPWFHIVDLNSFILDHGLQNLYDPRYEVTGRMFFTPKGSELFGDYLLRYLKASVVPSKKVLALDLDNTLWGGVLGEEGKDHLKLGPEGTGYAFLQFQRAVLSLKNDGVLLVTCSKNNEPDAKEVFEQHPEMLLKWTDFVAHRVNWKEKSENLKSMAQELNLGINSFVFFDDTVFEREMVRSALPEVDVIDVPLEPADYVKTLSDYRGFDTLNTTSEDQARSEMYLVEKKRTEMRDTSHSIEDYYRSLKIQATLKKADASTFERAYQLLHKTNQFNLTTKRYSKNELQELAASPSHEVWTVHIKDSLGESGITALLIVKKEGQQWEVDTFLMSCRIIGRTVEFGLLRWLATRALAQGAKRLSGEFIPTERNQVSKDFFENTGFHYESTSGKWILALKTGLKFVKKDYIEFIDEGKLS